VKGEKARSIPESVRREMIAEAFALAYDASTNLGKRAVIDVIAAAMDSIGDPLEKVWVEDATGKRRTHRVEQALAALGDRPNFRYLWAIPQSERRNSKSRWLTALTIDNVAAHGATLFFALPREVAKEFGPHVTLLRLLVESDIVPQYGFGYAREYGDPDNFALGYVGKGGISRHARQRILDVFPLNVLSDVHLQQRLGSESFKEWILRNTGPESLLQIGPRCVAWVVPAAQTVSIAGQLKPFGMTMREHPEPDALP
jgi:hypothetical protein